MIHIQKKYSAIGKPFGPDLIDYPSDRFQPIYLLILYKRLNKTIREYEMHPVQSQPIQILTKLFIAPPEGETLIRDLLNNLEEFIQNQNIDIDPLMKMAIIHYQFEAIHPFEDENGRTGRIINILYLVLEDLLTLPVLYLSGYIIARKVEYYKLPRLVTEKEDWESWILFMLEAIE